MLAQLHSCVRARANKVLICDFNDYPVLLGNRKAIVTAVRFSPEHGGLATVENANHQEWRGLALGLLAWHKIHSLIVHSYSGSVCNSKWKLCNAEPSIRNCVESFTYAALIIRRRKATHRKQESIMDESQWGTETRNFHPFLRNNCEFFVDPETIA